MRLWPLSPSSPRLLLPEVFESAMSTVNQLAEGKRLSQKTSEATAAAETAAAVRRMRRRRKSKSRRRRRRRVDLGRSVARSTWLPPGRVGGGLREEARGRVRARERWQEDPSKVDGGIQVPRQIQDRGPPGAERGGGRRGVGVRSVSEGGRRGEIERSIDLWIDRGGRGRSRGRSRDRFLKGEGESAQVHAERLHPRAAGPLPEARPRQGLQIRSPSIDRQLDRSRSRSRSVLRRGPTRTRMSSQRNGSRRR